MFLGNFVDGTEKHLFFSYLITGTAWHSDFGDKKARTKQKLSFYDSTKTVLKMKFQKDPTVINFQNLNWTFIKR